jgi:phenylacetate-CoA ligase
LARRRLAETLTEARRAPFHRTRLERLGADTVQAEAAESALVRLPLLHKRDLQTVGQATLAGGRGERSWRSSRSTGSTGEPLRVFYDPRAWAILKHLVKLRARMACGMRLSDRVALLDAFIPPGADAVPHASRAAALRARRVLRLSALEAPDRLAARLADFRPDAIYGLPSALLDVASALARSRGRLAPRSVFTSGELLTSGLRAAIADAFRCRVFDVYGTSETKEIAWECPAGGMHLNADVVWLEVLDEDGRGVPARREGAFVATSLVNRAMPLIRYVTGDRGFRTEERCPCGVALPLLGVVTGREAEHVTLAGGRRVSPYTFTLALEPVEALLRYQIVQLAPARFVVRAQLRDGAAPDLAARIQAALRAALREPVQVDLESVERLPRGPGIKFRVVVPLAAGADAPPLPARPGGPGPA